MKQWMADALDVLWPVQCASCGRAATNLCEECLAEWPPKPRSLHDLPLIVLGDYSGGLRDAVLASKEQGNASVTKKLGLRLATGCPAADAVAIVPPSASGLRKRGFHAVTRLARVIARQKGVRAFHLRFAIGDAVQQKRLGKEAREVANRTMSLSRQLRGQRVVVVDDVVTTGATVIAASNAVTEAGGIVVGILAVAHTPRRSGLG